MIFDTPQEHAPAFRAKTSFLLPCFVHKCEGAEEMLEDGGVGGGGGGGGDRQEVRQGAGGRGGRGGK